MPDSIRFQSIKGRHKPIVATVGIVLVLGLLTFTTFSPKENPRMQKTLRNLSVLQDVLVKFHSACGRYPLTSDDLGRLVSGDNLGCKEYHATKKLDGSYIIDGDGKPLVYSSDGKAYLIKTKENEGLQITDQTTVDGKQLSK